MAAMEIKTHQDINPKICGIPRIVEPGHSRIELKTIPVMAVDPHGLVHGGFVFGLADHAAMVAVNDPHVVLGASESRFIQPVTVSDILVADARVEAVSGKKHQVVVIVTRGDALVYKGSFTCFVLDRHVLDKSSI